MNWTCGRSSISSPQNGAINDTHRLVRESPVNVYHVKPTCHKYFDETQKVSCVTLVDICVPRHRLLSGRTYRERESSPSQLEVCPCWQNSNVVPRMSYPQTPALYSSVCLYRSKVFSQSFNDCVENEMSGPTQENGVVNWSNFRYEPIHEDVFRRGGDCSTLMGVQKGVQRTYPYHI